ncbi:hypothetical protein [Isachenkonia alkalipeptolytica]|uniref:Lipoprotein n=1 Tax=Isachenkonia alkalipeptolytica TaxID=2565777 RepID=A0AA43XN45_9CLOT|nr:hypothetical protein [Isachenkonia alkalipeptolytica]NBG89536.1 hypothetical protein [Isachenkonia alkalipeptolytica]
MGNTMIKKSKGIMALGVLLLLLLVGCSTSNLKIGYISSGVGNTLTASYYYFDGIESRKIEGEPGEIITIAYNSEVKKGNLEMKIESPTGEVYPLPTEHNSEEIVEIPVDKTGTFRLIVMGERTRGSFSVSWSAI